MDLRQSTASQEVVIGPFLDSTDGDTAETALTIANTDIKIWKHGATTLANKNSGGATHISNGLYHLTLDATDTDTLGNFEININVAGALAVRREFVVRPADVFDADVLGTDVRDVNVTHVADTAQTANDNGADINAILADTNELQTNQGDWATATGFSSQASVDTIDSNVDAILVDTGTTIPASISGLNDLSAAEVNTQVDTALSDYDGPTRAEATADKDAIIAQGDSAWTTGAGGGSGLDAAGVRAAVGLASANLDTQLSAIDTVVDSILVDTDDLQSNQGDWATATGFATATDLATVDSNVDAILVDTGTTIPTLIGTPVADLATDIAGISGGSGLTASETRAALGMSSANLDTQLSTILADTADLQANQGDWVTATGYATESALTAAVVKLDAVKVSTDKFVFTKTNQVDVNILSINGVTITGDGAGTPFTV